jgi:mannose-6-phosphate isomerase-like protein (cupin superfamily)
MSFWYNNSFFYEDIESLTRINTLYRRVLFTTVHSQLVIMALAPRQKIPLEIHKGDQFIRFEMGNGEAIIGGKTVSLSDGTAIMIPSGTPHEIVAGDSGLKMYIIYSPPEHEPVQVDIKQ